MKKLMLLDGMSLINRAFYALPAMSNKAGVPTNAILGFLNIYFKLLDEELPDYGAVVFDLPAPTFRHKRFADYKATRKSFPDDLRTQIPILKELLGLMNIRVVSLEGYEADDVMATLAVNAENTGFLTTIVTGDRDLLQIATDRIKIRIPKTRGGVTTTEDYFAADFVAQMGITPTEYIDMKALMGDASDNIPGVASIGEKTALKIIQDYKNIEAAIDAVTANPAAIKPKKAAENLREFADLARLSKELATIITDAGVGVEPDELVLGEMFTEEAFNELRRLEIKSVLKKFGDKFSGAADSPAISTISGKIFQNQQEFSEFYETTDPIAFYILWEGGKMQGLGVGKGEDIAFAPPSLDFTAFFESDTPKVGFDVKKDMRLLRQMDINLKNVAFDLLLGGYLLGNLKDGDGVGDLSLQYLGETLDSGEKADGQLSLLDAPKDSSESLAQSAFAHVSAISRACPIMVKHLEEQEMTKLFHEVEMPLLGVLADMEHHGIAIDAGFITEYGAKLTIEIDRLTAEIYNLAGQEFNINSPKQLAKVLFEDMGLKGGKKTKTGYSTNVDVLQKLAKTEPIADKILEYRSFAKLRSTYADGLLSAINPKTGKIHTTFNQALTSTGRLSSAEPNLQNIPVRTDLGRELRRAFIASDGFTLVDADYSQIELRILAELSGDETFLEAFAQNQDIHRITAARAFQIPLEEVDDQTRGYAKAINFGIVYGISAFSLAEDIGVSVKEADGFINNYFERYPKVKKYMDYAVRRAKLEGYAETIWGRRRLIPELSSGNYMTR
ncbi:MAG: DNA polymerase I, partial [Defluviitaleaceae bacterium]|nr:DNA polymerase I [Defluviitaleaceae bacterium]